jgi:octaprenyl-diphosphate synthase
VDDLMDYLGSEEQNGKEPGRDLSEGKVTLPVIKAFAKGSPEQRQRIRRIFESRQRKACLGELTAILEQLGGFTHTVGKARQHAARALGLMAAFPASEARLELERAARAVVDQVHCPAGSVRVRRLQA